MLNVANKSIMLRVITLNVVMLSVVAPLWLSPGASGGGRTRTLDLWMMRRAFYHRATAAGQGGKTFQS
jgi:hypothetical protein